MGNMAILEKSLTSFNQGDWQTYRALVADDCQYSEYATGRVIRSGDDFVSNSQAWKKAFPNAQGVATKRIEHGDCVVEEITWSGTHTGEMHTPDGQVIPATGKSMSVHAAMISRCENGKIVETNHYFDMMTMLRQLGIAS